MNQVFQPVCRDVQREGVTGLPRTGGLFGSLCLQYAVDFLLDLVEFDRLAADADTPAERIKQVQRFLLAPMRIPG